MTTMTREFRSTLAAWKREQPAAQTLHAIPEKVGRVTRTGRTKLYCGPAAMMIATGMPFEIADRLLQIARKQPVIVGTSLGNMKDAFDLAGWELSRNKLLGGKPRRIYTQTSTIRVTLSSVARFDFGHRGSVKSEAKTLAHWIDSRTIGQMADTYLVELTSHWMIVRGTRGCDNKSRVPMPVEELPYRRSRVEGVYTLTRR